MEQKKQCLHFDFIEIDTDGGFAPILGLLIAFQRVHDSYRRLLSLLDKF